MAYKGNKAVRLYPFDEELGYDWLIQEDEETGSNYCGCTITRGSERFGDESIMFKYCDMHRSAGKALEALEALEQSARDVADRTHAASIGVDDPILSAWLADLWDRANKARAILKGVEQ